MNSIIECVPNFSEGRDERVVDAIANAIGAVAGVAILDRTLDRDHNRCVITFAGGAEGIAQAAVAGVAAAVEQIDLTTHTGVHPRMGAADVVPFVPVCGVSLRDCAEIAAEAGAEIWRRLRVPVYLYEAAARYADRTRLENIRLGRIVGPPDFGDRPHPTAGSTVVGAREFLIAWNINLRTVQLEVAKRIARKIRFSSGGLPYVKALGLPLISRGQVQVSINLTDFEITPLHVVFAAVEEEARADGVEVAGSELIGLIPARAIALSAGHDLRWENLRADSLLENRLSSKGLACPGSGAEKG